MHIGVNMEEMAEEKRDNGPKKTATEAWSKNWIVPVLLLMLREWSSYGYELMEKMATFGLGTMNAGTFYRTLRQMEKNGMVSSNWDTSEGGPARRVYSITDAGEAYLNFWAQSLDHYQKMMESFFRLYTGQPSPGKHQKQEQKSSSESLPTQDEQGSTSEQKS